MSQRADPRFRCQLGPAPKYRWDSIDKAWVGAFWLFATGDAPPLTPYFCKPLREHRARIRYRTQGNPWRWTPAFVAYVETYRFSSKGRSCGAWHLTRKTAHVLPPRKSEPCSAFHTADAQNIGPALKTRSGAKRSAFSGRIP